MVMMTGKPVPSVKLDKLMTQFEPERMILHVELVPPKGTTFETPLKESGKKLNMIANYARTIFDVELRKPLKKQGGVKRGK